MRRALRLALLVTAVDAAAKFALEKKGQKVLNVKLYETGYTFTNRGDKRKATTRSTSLYIASRSCRSARCSSASSPRRRRTS